MSIHLKLNWVTYSREEKTLPLLVQNLEDRGGQYFFQISEIGYFVFSKKNLILINCTRIKMQYSIKIILRNSKVRNKLKKVDRDVKNTCFGFIV